jgi:hypothetical protein
VLKAIIVDDEPYCCEQGAAIISVNNTIYVAGGKVNGAFSDQVWILEF